MWPFKSRPYGDRLSTIENAVNGLVAAVNSLIAAHNATPDAALVKEILHASLEQAKLNLVERSRARSATNARPRGEGGRFAKRTVNGKDPTPCRVCVNAGEPTLSADEIWWHGTGHTAALPKEWH